MPFYSRRLLILVLLVSACAQPTTMRPEVSGLAAQSERLEQTKLAMKQKIDRSARLVAIMSRLDVAAADFCPDATHNVIGLATVQAAKGSPIEEAAFEALYPNHGGRRVISGLAAGLAAQIAGLKVGDRIEAINGIILPTDADLARKAMSEQIEQGNAISLTVLREGAKAVVAVTPDTGCKVAAKLDAKNDLNAYTDGKAIYVFNGMMDFIKADDELALILGHELGHVVRGHVDAKVQNATVGQVIGLILGAAIAVGTGVDVTSTMGNLGGDIGANSYSVDFEAEADYVGLYIMARAGYLIDQAADFWRRMAVAHPTAISMTTDHPATADRFVALAATAKEIHAKQARGADLTPNEGKTDSAERAGTNGPRPTIFQQK